MKPTPRTDAEYASFRRTGTGTWDIAEGLADFARDLERQLSDALEREKALRQELERVRAEEREACARVCDDLRDEDGYEAWNTECAAAIRARKENT